VILEGQDNDGQATQSDPTSGTGVLIAGSLAMLRSVVCDEMMGSGVIWCSGADSGWC
jgi:hypothetical protein